MADRVDPPPRRFEPQATGISGVTVLGRTTRKDARGDFSRLHCAATFRELGIGFEAAVQTNVSRTHRRGTVRGLHLMKRPAEEYKLVTCLAGAVWDVAVDLRPDSATYLRWFSIELKGGEDASVILPPGVAHGFQALEDGTVMLYQHSVPYRADLDVGVRADDAELGIPWPLPIGLRSERDADLPGLRDFEGM